MFLGFSFMLCQVNIQTKSSLACEWIRDIFLALLLRLSHISSHCKVLIKWIIGLSLPLAPDCISIDFKASMHQRETRSFLLCLISSPLLSSPRTLVKYIFKSSNIYLLLLSALCILLCLSHTTQQLMTYNSVCQLLDLNGNIRFILSKMILSVSLIYFRVFWYNLINRLTVNHRWKGSIMGLLRESDESIKLRLTEG